MQPCPGAQHSHLACVKDSGSQSWLCPWSCLSPCLSPALGPFRCWTCPSISPSAWGVCPFPPRTSFGRAVTARKVMEGSGGGGGGVPWRKPCFCPSACPLLMTPRDPWKVHLCFSFFPQKTVIPTLASAVSPTSGHVLCYQSSQLSLTLGPLTGARVRLKKEIRRGTWVGGGGGASGI